MEKVAVELPVKKRVFEIQLFKQYKALRNKGSYCLAQIPNEFINGHYAGGVKYGISLGIDQENQHRIVILDLDDQARMINNRRIEEVKKTNEVV